MTIDLPENWISPAEDASVLIGIDENAFSIMGFVTSTLREAGNDRSVLDAYQAEAMSGNYDHLLRASIAYLGGLT